MSNASTFFAIFMAIAKPLLILLLAFFLLPPLFKRLRTKLTGGGQRGLDFSRELDAVYRRADNILAGGLEQGSDHEATGSAPERIRAAWAGLERTMKELGRKHLQVAADNTLYPWDYVLFELEMKKKVANSSIGIYRDLLRLKDIVEQDPTVTIPEEAASKYCRLAARVNTELAHEPEASGFSLF